MSQLECAWELVDAFVDKKVTKKVNTVVNAIVLCQSMLQDLVERTINQIDRLDDPAVRNVEAREAVRTLKRVCTAGQAYMVHMSEFIKCARNPERVDRAKAKVRRGDYTILRCLLDDMKSHLEDANVHYETYDRTCVTVGESMLKSYQEYVAQRKEARYIRTTVGVAGQVAGVGATAAGAAMGGTAAACAALSISSAPFTMGMGPLVGLGIAGAVAGGVGIVGLVTTATVRQRTMEKITQFDQIGKVFLMLSDEVCDLHEGLEQLKVYIEVLRTKMRNVHRLDQTEIENICITLDILYRACSEVDMADLKSFEERLKTSSKILAKKARRIGV